MGPTTDFKQWKRAFLNFLSIMAAYLITQLAIRESGVYSWTNKRNTTPIRCYFMQPSQINALTRR
jgi:hypothetical protein